MIKSIATDKAPGAIGPYSQGVSANGFLYVSGQLPVDAATGEIELKDVKKATSLCLDNLRAVLEAGGAGIESVVKVTVFMTDLAAFADMNGAYAAFFGDTKPARACVQVAALPRQAPVEIECIAAIGG